MLLLRGDERWAARQAALSAARAGPRDLRVEDAPAAEVTDVVAYADGALDGKTQEAKCFEELLEVGKCRCYEEEPENINYPRFEAVGSGSVGTTVFSSRIPEFVTGVLLWASMWLGVNAERRWPKGCSDNRVDDESGKEEAPEIAEGQSDITSRNADMMARAGCTVGHERQQQRVRTEDAAYAALRQDKRKFPDHLGANICGSNISAVIND
ncbi:hypothetical protein B0H13DRAFT_2289785 [Mycena leptocephala]|nr:hypothetical protein B0H13DRAFT_2289785 [Mycena leptocephala]